MKPPKLLPTVPPFLTILTMTHLRPQALIRNLESVGKQTAVEHLEQIVLPDHVGYGLAGGLFGRVPWYAEACRGDYVVFLNDDDALADEHVVQRLYNFVYAQKTWPEIVIVKVYKGGQEFPKPTENCRPVEGCLDLGSYVLRRDVWMQHRLDYGLRYQGDYDHAMAMYRAGKRTVESGILFAVGPLSNGRPEKSL